MKYQPLPGEGQFTDEDVQRIIDRTPLRRDPMLSAETDQCRCATCGLYFGSTYAFDQHRKGKLGSPERRCLTQAELVSSGWKQTPRGHWRSPARIRDWAARRSE